MLQSSFFAVKTAHFYAYSTIWYGLTGGMTNLGGKGCEESLQFEQAGRHFRPHDVITHICARGNPFLYSAVTFKYTVLARLYAPLE